MGENIQKNKKRKGIWQRLLACFMALMLISEYIPVGLAHAADSLNITDYLKGENAGITMSYRAKGSDNSVAWTPVTSDTVLGDVALRFEGKFSGLGNQVKLPELQDVNGIMTIQMPDALRNFKVGGDITDSEGKDIGDVVVTEDGLVTLKYDLNWISEQRNAENPSNVLTLSTFFVEAEVDLRKFSLLEPSRFVFGDVVLDFQKESDLIAKYSDIEVKKNLTSESLITDETGTYLAYSITVTAGEDGAQNASVTDVFEGVSFTDIFSDTITASAIEGYTDTSASKGTISYGTTTIADETQPTMTWNIGAMEPGEVQTLTYRAKINEGLLGGGKRLFTNNATVYDAGIEKDSSSAEYTTTATGKIEKTNAALNSDGTYIKDNGDGTFDVDYTIVITADANNSYTWKEVQILDSLQYGGTNKKIYDRIEYKFDSFVMYEGTTATGTGTPMANGGDSGIRVVKSTQSKSATIFPGELAPGQSKTITYTITVDKGIFTEAIGTTEAELQNRKKDVTIKNSVSLRTKTDYGRENITHTSSTISKLSKTWLTKGQGELQSEAKTVTVDTANAYALVEGGVAKVSDAPSSFEVIDGDYLYTITLNVGGEFDISQAVITDTISNSQFMKYTGWLRVDAYPANDKSNKTTRWVNIDGLDTFTFTPESLGFASNDYEYRLEYYTRTDTANLANVSNVYAFNTIEMEGTIGIPGTTKTYELSRVYQTVTLNLEGGLNLDYRKYAWHYDATYTSDKFTKGNGALYWMLAVSSADGTTGRIPEGFQISDRVHIGDGADRSAAAHYVNSDSVAGIYIAPTAGVETYNQYPTYNSLAEYLTATNAWVDESKYTVSAVSSKDVRIKFTEEIIIPEGYTLIVLIRTQPEYVLDNNASPKSFVNRFYISSDEGKTWPRVAEANQAAALHPSIRKYSRDIYTYDGTTVTSMIKEMMNKNWNVNFIRATDLLDQQNLTGTFVSWGVRVNLEGLMHGDYIIEDTIPEGMEIAYVRLASYGSSAYAQEVRPYMGEISDIGEGWTKYEFTDVALDNTNSGGTANSIYYVNGNTVKWTLNNLIATGVVDVSKVYFEVVCRVVDQNTLLGAETDFTNTVNLYNKNGVYFATSSDTVTINKNILTKEAVIDGTTGSSATYPFIITLNPDGEDLVADSNTLTIVDEMSATLTFNYSSVRVTNTATNEQLSSDQYTVGVNGNVITFTVPDHMPLAITYDTTINAAPGQLVDIENVAHWEGIVPEKESVVEVENYVYRAGAISGSSNTPQITVIKRNSKDGTLLEGATFKLEEVTVVNGKVTVVSDGMKLTATTGSNGQLVFGTGDDHLAYNTFYRVTETNAAKGFMIDETPFYVAVSDANSAPAYANLIVEAEALLSSGADVSVQYSGSYRLSVTRYNTPYGTTLPSTGGAGTSNTNNALYAGFVAIALAGIIMALRKKSVRN